MDGSDGESSSWSIRVTPIQRLLLAFFSPVGDLPVAATQVMVTVSPSIPIHPFALSMSLLADPLIPAAAIAASRCVAWLLLAGYMPFWGRTDEDLFFRILRNQLDFSIDPWPAMSPQAVDLVRCLLCSDASARLTASQALRHAWIAGHCGATAAAAAAASAAAIGSGADAFIAMARPEGGQCARGTAILSPHIMGHVPFAPCLPQPLAAAAPLSGSLRGWGQEGEYGQNWRTERRKGARST